MTDRNKTKMFLPIGGGGGVAENPSHAAARRRKLAWSSPKLQILHLGRRTDTSPSNTFFPNPETVDYDFVERS